jgi:hypothetical protein
MGLHRLTLKLAPKMGKLDPKLALLQNRRFLTASLRDTFGHPSGPEVTLRQNWTSTRRDRPERGTGPTANDIEFSIVVFEWIAAQSQVIFL